MYICTTPATSFGYWFVSKGTTQWRLIRLVSEFPRPPVPFTLCFWPLTVVGVRRLRVALRHSFLRGRSRRANLVSDAFRGRRAISPCIVLTCYIRDQIRYERQLPLGLETLGKRCSLGQNPSTGVNARQLRSYLLRTRLRICYVRACIA